MRFGSLSLALLTLGMTASARASVIGYWPLDGGTDQIADVSGAANHGLLSNATTGTWVGGVRGDALYFSGGVGPTCVHVEIPDSPSLRITSAVSFSAWVWAQNPNRDAPIFAKEGPNGWLSYWFGIFYNSFGMLLDRDGYQGWDGYDRDQGSVPAGVWTHLASTWDGVNIRHYMNGKLVTGGIAFSGPVRVSPAKLFIGANSAYIDFGNATAFNGVIDEARMFDHALSAVEVDALAVMPPQATVTGSVELLDYVGQGSVPLSCTLTLGPMVEHHDDVVRQPDGSFTFQTRRRGTWNLTVKAPHWLAKKVTVDITDDPNQGAMVSLTNGDVDNDNQVTVFDYSRLSDAFDKSAGDAGFDPDADLDGDGAVTVFDYAVLSDAFDQSGD